MKPEYASSRYDKWHKYGSVAVLLIGMILYAHASSLGVGMALRRMSSGIVFVLLIWHAEHLAVSFVQGTGGLFRPESADVVLRVICWILLLLMVAFRLASIYGLLAS